jgi:hypothetical protein
VIDLMVNVAVCRARTEEPVSVDAAIRQSWPKNDPGDVADWCTP